MYVYVYLPTCGLRGSIKEARSSMSRACALLPVAWRTMPR